jgi:hypothetical protein
MVDMFPRLKESEIDAGNFNAGTNSTMFAESERLEITGGFFFANNENQGKGVEESGSGGMLPSASLYFYFTTTPLFSDVGGEMFKELDQSRITQGVFVSQGGGKMFERSKGLVITGGNFTASGGGTKAGKGKNTAKIPQGVCIIARYSLPHFLIELTLYSGPGLAHSPGSLGILANSVSQPKFTNDPGPFRVCIHPSTTGLSELPIGSRNIQFSHLSRHRCLQRVNVSNERPANCAYFPFPFRGARPLSKF